jgi:ParB family chromosome partitioning protein
MTAAVEVPKRRALGKGLESLLPGRSGFTSTPAPAAPPPALDEGKPREIPVDQIERNPFQTRGSIDENALKELSASIAATGVVQPVLVRPLADNRFQLIAGERRWLASKLAGKTTVPAILRHVSDDRLGHQFKMTQEQMAQRTGKDRASVANFLRLLRLPIEVQQKVESGNLSFGHARTLLSLESPDAILKAAQKVSALSMSVRQTESYVQGLLNPEKKPKGEEKEKPPLDPNVREARDLLQRALGLKVSIEDKNGRGRVIIEYSRLEDFDALLQTIAGK